MKSEGFPILPEVVELVKYFESLHDGNLTKIGLQPKMCPVGIWTEGYGEAMIDPQTGEFLRGEENRVRAEALATITNEMEASERLSLRLFEYSGKMTDIMFKKRFSKPLSVMQMNALLSFTYNCGTGAFTRVLERLDAGETIDCINEWRNGTVKGRKVVLPGLVRRRLAEVNLFKTSQLKFYV